MKIFKVTGKYESWLHEELNVFEEDLALKHQLLAKDPFPFLLLPFCCLTSFPQSYTLLAFTQGPGVVLRCSGCENVVLRIVKTSEAIFLDARGAVYLRLARA